MKYSVDEALDEIKRRGKCIKKRHEERVRQLLTASVILIAVVLLGTVSFLGSKGVQGIQTVYGSFLLPAEAGGYVITAILAFVAGAGLTLFIQKHKEAGDTRLQNNQNMKEHEG